MHVFDPPMFNPSTLIESARRGRRCAGLRRGAGWRARSLADAPGRDALGQGRRHRPLRARQRRHGALPGPARCRTSVGHTDAELFDPSLATVWRAAEQTALAQPQPLSSEHRFEWAGERHDFAVLRLSASDGSQAQRWLCSVWTDQSPQRQKDAQLRAALEQLEQQQRANEQLRRELADQGLRDSATGLYTRPHFDDQLRREVDLSTREHREFALVLIELDPLERVRALGAPAADAHLRGHGPAAARQHPRDGRLVPARRAPLRGAAVGRGPGHRPFAHGRPAPPVRDADRRARRPGTGLHACRWAWPASRTPRSTQEELLSACEGALAEAQPPRRQPRHAGQHPLRAGG